MKPVRQFALILCVLILLAGGQAARSASINWTNIVGGSWNTAANWDPNQVPGSGDSVSISGNGVNVIIDATNSAGGIYLDSDASLTIASKGVMNINGAVDLYGVLTNQGTVNWQAGEVDVWETYASGAIWNQAGALWSIQCDNEMFYRQGYGPFENAGTISKIAGTGITYLYYLNFTNSGSVQAHAGTINFSGGSSDLGGSFQADANATINLNGSYTISNAPSNFYGPGPVQFTSGAYVTLNGLVGSLDLYGAYITGQSTVKGTLNLHSGGLYDNGSGVSLTIASNAVLNTDGDVSLLGPLTIASKGVMNINGAFDLYGVLTNQGTVNWLAGQVDQYYRPGSGYFGAIWNQAGALWSIQCDNETFAPYDDAPFLNAGTVSKTAGTGTTYFYYFNFTNSGSVQAHSGTIEFDYGTNDLNGSFQADAGAGINFSGNYTISSAPGSFHGPGPVQFSGGSLTLNGLVGSFTMDGPMLAGQSTVNGTLNLLSGGVQSDASLTIESKGVMNINGAVDLYGVLTNQGTVNWQAGEVDVWETYASGAIWNQAGAIWSIQCDNEMFYRQGYGHFENAGTISKIAGTGITYLYYLNFTNSGSVQAHAGTINFNQGSYSETSSAKDVIGIGGTTPGSDYGQLSFSSPTAMAGSFNVTLLNGFRPSPGDSFTVLSYPSLTSDFSSLNGLDLGNGLQLAPQFGSASLTLMAKTYPNPTNPKPSLSLYATPNGALVWWPINYTGWQLQNTTNLATHIWTPVPVAGTNNNIVMPRTGPKGFFRLKGS